MGDIFDLLVGEISATHAFAKPYISVLESLAERMEIYYFEGNHDFNLSRFFQKVRVIPLQNQPLVLHTSKGNDEKFFLAHGDIFLNPFLQFLLKSLRNPFLLRFLNFINILTFSSITNCILARQKRKNLFYSIANFKNLAYERYAKYQANGAWVVEGHYHQNLLLQEGVVKYFNLPSFAYERSFFVVEFLPEVKFEKQKLRGQDV
ncbi:UDP-2,3-diacylglucosamine diphosphatase [Campylobacter felis]|uniref:UDP-2,3-diacylglucosamine diphosphatase n=1 Tax=Campylobacter felis TaxID=2974565 RepID=UPI00256C185F|nr:UDP-2,3-diacylglucosamine diphosphatase [Campylobacter felis]